MYKVGELFLKIQHLECVQSVRLLRISSDSHSLLTVCDGCIPVVYSEC